MQEDHVRIRNDHHEFDRLLLIGHAECMKPTILMTGHTMPALLAEKGDFDRWFARRFGWPVERFRVIDAIGGEALPLAGSVEGLIISGSAHCVHDYADWSVQSGEWIAEVMARGTPILGVCYGHQLIGDILGGDVGINPKGREMGVCPIEHMGDDPLFEGLPKNFSVIQTHVDAVNTLPETAQRIARSDLTEIQAMAIGENVRTIQWHPEFDADVIRHYITVRANLVDAEFGPGAATRMLNEVVDVHSGAQIIHNFMRHFLHIR